MSELGPITAELRAALDVDREFMRADGTVVPQTFCADRDDFERCCDAIDAVHACLERENAELRQRVEELGNGGGSMHDGGCITDELREWMDRTTVRFDDRGCLLGTAEELTAIADRIDAEHQKAEDEWRAKNGDMWLKGYAACHEELMEGHPVIAADLEKAGWVKLPVDADGVPICVGDVMAYTDNTKPMEVVALVPPAVFLTEEGPRYADMCRHHHAPTVEDVLTEMLYKAHIYDEREMELLPDLIAEYAAKLRLAGDAE